MRGIGFSFGKNLGDAYQTAARGRRVCLAVFRYPRLFLSGLILVALGFLLAVVGSVAPADDSTKPALLETKPGAGRPSG